MTVGSEQLGAQERFIAVAFTQPWPDQSDMPDWHQHMTIFPWVRGDLAATGRVLEQFAPALRPINAAVVEGADFGKGQPLPVWLLGPAPVLRGLHKVCLALLNNVASLEDATFTGEKYTPHITIHPQHPELAPSEELVIRAISLVHKVGDHRVIYKTIGLGDG